MPVGKEIPRSTASDESLAWAIQQLQHCQQSHQACNSLPRAPLPSRVLDVSGTEENGVRLYVSEGETAPYAALSHCWGHKPFLRTLSGSLDAHRSEIPWARLPQTFQDAVAFTRKIGVRYLWIDSLCIVQDDQLDWRREAAKMASVYQGATLVISAAKSDGAYGGLYADVPERHRTYTVTFSPDQHHHHTSDSLSSSKTEAANPHTIHCRVSLTHTHRLLSPYHASTAAALPIFTRAWILQERFLAPRLLHFGPEELSFECLASAACQCTPTPPTPSPPQQQQDPKPNGTSSGEPTWYRHMLDRTARPKYYYSLPRWQQQALLQPNDNGNGNDENGGGEEDLRLCWRRLVEDYTRLRLTFERDVFPAIGGMARVMQGVLGSIRAPNPNLKAEMEMETGEGRAGTRARYVAGLWADGLVVGDLLWRVELPPPPPPGSVGSVESGGEGEEEGWEGEWRARARPGTWRAPSWSWAAVRLPVEFVGGQDGVEAACEVVQVKCELAGADEMGELREGGTFLVLKGRLIPARLRFKDAKDPQPWNVIDLDILDGGHVKNLWADDNCRGLVAAEGEQPSVFCLVVGRKLPRRELLCLVLTRVPEDGTTADQNRASQEDGYLYKRIALLEVFGGPPSPVLWGWVHNLLAKGEDALVRIV